MDDQPEAAEGALPLDAGDDVVGQLDVLLACAPRTNSPGWMTNGSSAPISTCSVRLSRRLARSIAGDAEVVEDAERSGPGAGRRDAGWTIAGSQGSILIRPSSTRRRIVPSESTDVGIAGGSLRLMLARLRVHRANACGGEQRRGVAVRAAAGRARERAVRVQRAPCCRRPRTIRSSAPRRTA